MPLEELGKAMAAATERHGEHPLFVLETGRDLTGRVPAIGWTPSWASVAASTGCSTIYFGHLERNAEMIEFMRELRGRGLRMALLTNNVREWEPRWRPMLPEIDEIFEVVVDSAFVGHAKARAARSTSSRWSASAADWGRATACSWTTSRSTATRRARSAGPPSSSRPPTRPSARSRRRSNGPEPGVSRVEQRRDRAPERSASRFDVQSLMEAVALPRGPGRGGDHRGAQPRPPSSGGRRSPRAKRRSTSAQLAWRTAVSQSATTCDSCSISSAPRRTPDTQFEQNCARWSVKRSTAHPAAGRPRSARAGAHPLELARRRPRRTAPRGRRSAGRPMRSETPARSAIRSAVGLTSPSSSSASSASTIASRVRSARTLRPSRVCSTSDGRAESNAPFRLPLLAVGLKRSSGFAAGGLWRRATERRRSSWSAGATPHWSRPSLSPSRRRPPLHRPQTFRFGPVKVGPVRGQAEGLRPRHPQAVQGRLHHRDGGRHRRRQRPPGADQPPDAAPHRVPQHRAQARRAARRHVQPLHRSSTPGLRSRPGASASAARARSGPSMRLPPGYGYPMKGKDQWAMTWMMMNHRNNTDTAYIQYTVTYDTAPKQPVKPYWLDMKNCRLDPDVRRARRQEARVDPPKRRSTWTAPASGRIVAGGGHVHGGAKQHHAQPGPAAELYTSKPTWGTPKPSVLQRQAGAARARPGEHERVHQRQGLRRKARREAAAGLQLRRRAARTPASWGSCHPLHGERRPGWRSAVGAQSPPTCASSAATARGRKKPPRFKVPLTGLKNGKAREIKRPRRPAHAVGERLGDRRSATASSLRQRLVARGRPAAAGDSAARELHNVTVASGPRGFSSAHMDRGADLCQASSRRRAPTSCSAGCTRSR